MHPGLSIKCPQKDCERICGFSDQESLGRHLEIHEKPSKCIIPQGCAHPAKRLIYIHHGYELDGFASQGSLNRLQSQEYTTRKPHKCFACDRSFNTQRKCNYHQDTSYADNKLTCDHENCDRPYGFATPESLYRYLLSHRRGHQNSSINCGTFDFMSGYNMH